MSTSTWIGGGDIITPEGVVRGAVRCVDGLIAEVSAGNGVPLAHDLDGDFLLPGLVELHTDHLETHLVPRPGVVWPYGLTALVAHDAQLVGAGITTVFDSVCVGEPMSGSNRAELLRRTIDALESGHEHGLLKADHLLHLRCEVSDPDVLAMLEPHLDNPYLRLVSVMDHTPGQRQWTDLEKYRLYHRRRAWSDEDLADVVRQRTALHERHADSHRRTILGWCAERGLAVASHDDTVPAHVRQARAEGITISEFPTTVEAAREARVQGQTIVVGAPNVVRGVSHSGNVSALDLAREGLLDVLSSDYLPISQLCGAFALHRELGMPVHRAVALVTEHPARAAGLNDRGSILPGKRADLVRVSLVDGVPVVRGVWRQGCKVA